MKNRLAFVKKAIPKCHQTSSYLIVGCAIVTLRLSSFFCISFRRKEFTSFKSDFHSPLCVEFVGHRGSRRTCTVKMT